MTRRRTLLLSALALPAVLGLALFIGWWQVDGPGGAPEIAQRPLALTNMSFALVDHDGNPVGPQTLVGQPSIVFFGFTFCPDVCPTTLSDISGWLDDLGADAERLNTVFITVDPERDTVEAMAEYVGYFHPAMRGWTGPEAQIAKAADGFRASYERVPAENGGYTMNHTAGVFLFDAAGRFVSTIDYHESREFAVPKIRRAMNRQESGWSPRRSTSDRPGYERERQTPESSASERLPARALGRFAAQVAGGLAHTAKPELPTKGANL